MIYSHEVQHMCCVAQGAKHGPAPIPQEGQWVKSKEIKDISGFTHGIGWCAPQQGACKLSLNVKDGVIQEALIETIGCSGMTHSAAMASEILPGKTILEALNTDLVCDAINTAMRELFLQIVYGRTQSAFSEGGLPVGAGLEDLGKGLRSQVGTMFGTVAKGPRYLEMAEGYCSRIALDKNNEIIGYEFVHLGKFMEEIKKGTDANEALKKVTGTYGRFTEEQGAVKYIDPRNE
ncbi:MAG: hypothetical protein IKW65_05145 [Bacteroidales bacterium]|nr:hypothetical protein [Bacteroidales bacterium]